MTSDDSSQAGGTAEQAAIEGRASLRRAAARILAVSFVVLFQELALIRWLPGQVRVLAYFPNLILISSFLGLGLGCLRAGRRPLAWLWPAGLAVLVAAASAMSHVAFTDQSVSEHLWLLYFDLPKGAPVVHAVQPPIVLCFILSAVCFVPLGQLLAENLETFRRSSSSLWGYCWDLTGSLIGVIAFATVGLLGLFPWTWFAVFLLVGCCCFVSRRALAWVLPAALLLPLAVSVTERADSYSPYYAIKVEEKLDGTGFGVLTNGSLHQRATPVKESDEIDTAWGSDVREGYHAPYRLLRRPPGKVLVLGAGTGNDVAVLLDEGATRVDAVEIDPIILSLGDEHPNEPYASPRVRKINTDARSYLNETEETYDLIVFGTLDSMTRLSALSNVRLDNFVYTRECMESARRRLAPGGGMVLYFMVATEYIDARLFGLLASTFDALPAVRTEYSRLFNRVYMAGPAFAHLGADATPGRDRYFESVLPGLELPTDDWPYLYLRERGLSGFYISLIAIFLALAVGSVFLASRDMRKSLSAGRGPDIEMFLFGVGFLLMETKFVTSMSLVWGATWLTSAVVFGAVLLTLLLSTIAMQRRPFSWQVASYGLLLSLVATYAIPLRLLLVDSVGLRLLLSVLLVGAPIFFAAACFAIRFRGRPSPGIALGWNLLGAVTGGLLEFLSMTIGLSALSLVAAVAYLLAFWVRERSGRPRAADGRT